MDGGASQLAPDETRKPERTVVAALLLRDSKLLICQRRKDDTHALQWEFPGGKVEPGESLSEALARELREELGIEAIIGKEVFRTRHSYRESQSQLELIFFLASVDRTALFQNLAFEQFEWAQVSTLTQYDFLPADREFVGLLANGSILLDSVS
jgi:8-oxo-dGTP diphosphatase